ncbi:MAG TPA: pyruvate dehydrogenase (acetyl-transferring) E1 component subunit alpha [Methylomirabilota bacterium]|nr:pyruvate dehydrogenase (acetyl-transferring) E1 component subunit alpha [Methylomirabilota bacterium]
MTLELLQIIKPSGEYVEQLEPEISHDELKRLYKLMMLVRNLDTRSLQLQRQGRIGFYIGCLGQEAAQIGSAYALKPEDWIFPAYREVGTMLQRGIPLEDLMNQYFANAEDIQKGRQLMNLYGRKSVNYVTGSAPIATQLPHAVGAAFAAKLRGDKVVTLVYFGEGATSANDFHTGMNFAGVYKTPTIFFCQNNHYAISLPVERQTATESIAVKAKAYGFEGVRVDGNDILAVYRTTKEAVDRARSNDGPTLIEAVTYRMGPHSSSDDPKRYRSNQELDEWQTRDPLVRFRKYLERKRIWSSTDEEKAQQDTNRQIDEAIAHAEKIPRPTIETLFTDVYAELPWHLQEQFHDLKDEEEAQ